MIHWTKRQFSAKICQKMIFSTIFLLFSLITIPVQCWNFDSSSNNSPLDLTVKYLSDVDERSSIDLSLTKLPYCDGELSICRDRTLGYLLLATKEWWSLKAQMLSFHKIKHPKKNHAHRVKHQNKPDPLQNRRQKIIPRKIFYYLDKVFAGFSRHFDEKGMMSEKQKFMT